MADTDITNNLHQQLQELVALACSYPARSLKRRQNLNELVRVVTKSGKLWRENTPYYKDALQQTWLYFCRNPEQYDPERCSVITWLNNSLKWRLQDLRISLAEDQVRTVSGSMPGTEEKTNPLENLPASPDIPPILEETYKWAETDLNGELAKTHIQGRPDVTCQILILRRLPPETLGKLLPRNSACPRQLHPIFINANAYPAYEILPLNRDI